MNKKIIFTALMSCSLVLTSASLGYAAAFPSHDARPEGHSMQATITVEHAKEIALKQVKGRIVHIDMDTDNGVLKYEVIIITDQNEVYEAEINSNTGQVIKVEKENN